MKHFFSLLVNVLRWAGLLWLLAAAGPALASSGPGQSLAGPAPSLAEALNPDGTLRASAQGSFDAHQFVMHTGLGGRPTFSPARTAATGDENWRDGFGIPGTDGLVNAVLQSGTDVYIGGYFTVVDGITAYEVAKWDGTRWSSLGTGNANGVLGGNVKALAMSGTTLYAGGRFNTAGGVDAGNIAKWDGTSWSSMGGGMSASYGTDAYVNALAVSGTTVYAGGKFLYAGTGASLISANQIAQWNGTRWSSLGTGTNNGVTGYLASVSALAITPTGLCVGGYFSKAGTVAANNIARWNGTAWSSLGTGTTNGVDGTVNALAVSGTTLYAGGAFTRAGTAAANYVAKWDGTAWSSLGTGATNGVAGGGVQVLTMMGTSLYVGGNFTAAGGTRANNLAKWDGTAWSSPGTGAPNGIGTTVVYGLAAVGTSLYVGGTFSLVNGAISNYIAKLDGNTWSRPGTNPSNGVGSSSTTSPAGFVTTILVAGTNVYIGGEFRVAGNVAANYVAKWDGTSWSSLGTGAANGANAPVYALAMVGSTLYAGGAFTQIGGLPILGLAQWDGTAWSSVGTGLDRASNSAVYALAAAGTTLYAGGAFSQIGGVAANNIAQWDGSTWSSLGTGTANGISGGSIRALAVEGANLYVGGYFTAAGGARANSVARWDGTSWNTLGTGAANGVSDYVYALAVVGSKLFAGGQFYQAGGAEIRYLAQWDGTSWSAVGGGVNRQVNALAAAGNNLYVGGQFYQAGGKFIPDIAKWDGTAWSGLGAGLGNSVGAVAIGPGDNVNAGGNFTSVYGYDSKIVYHYGIYNETPAPVLTDIVPGSGSVGTIITLKGLNLTGATTVSFNGTLTTAIINSTATSLTVAVPAGATNGPVVVVTPGGVSNSLPFIVAYPDLVVSTTTTIAPGIYNSITVTGTGSGTLGGGVTVNGSVVVQAGGTLNTNCQPLTGPGSFTLAAGATLGICDPLGIAATGATGAVQLAGTRSFSLDASYVYNGTVTQITGNGLPSQVRNLSTTNETDLMLSAPTSIAQVLTVGAAGDLLLNGNSLTLLSSASGTALVVNTKSQGSVQGNVTVQRYLDPSLNSGLGYRHYAAPVLNTTVADLGTPSGFTPTVNPAYNTSAMPGTVRPFPTVFGYDQDRLATVTSNYGAFDKGWVSPAAPSNYMGLGYGFAVQIGADQLVDFTGGLVNGSVVLDNLRRNDATTPNAEDAGWQLLGNPYPSPIDFSLIADGTDRVNLDGSCYVVESTGPYTGSYRAYVNGLPAGGSLIGTAQGFFVRVRQGQTKGALTFRNAHRLTTYTTQVPVRRTAADSRPLVQLELRGSSLADVFYAYAEAGARPAFDSQYDAQKLPNTTGLNLASVALSGERLAIDGRPAFTATTVLPLAVGVPAAGSYTLRAAALNNLPTGLDAYLADAQTGQAVKLTPSTSYSFSVSADQATNLLLGRFSLRFSPIATLATVPALTTEAVSVYPNPAHEGFVVTLPGVTGTSSVQAELLTALGQVVHRQQVALPASGIRLALPTAGLAVGVYTLRLQAGATILVKRVVIY